MEINRINKKKEYAIGMLVYPSIDNAWNYFFGAVAIVHQLKKNLWYLKNCDFAILTPKIENNDVLRIINDIFDLHVTYSDSLKLNSKFTFNPKWHGVFNKLYFFNPDIFQYKRLLIMDTDMFVFRSSGYIKALTDIDNGIAGAYENGYINQNKTLNLKFGTTIPTQYTSYTAGNKSYYNMINAGLLSIEPNKKIFDEMCKDLKDGWSIIENKYNSLKGKKGNNIYPEQEYLTGYFSGKWKSLPVEDFLSIKPTSNHYCNGQLKYWDEMPKKLDAMILSVCSEIFIKYPTLKKLNLSKVLSSKTSIISIALKQR